MKADRNFTGKLIMTSDEIAEHLRRVIVNVQETSGMDAVRMHGWLFLTREGVLEQLSESMCQHFTNSFLDLCVDALHERPTYGTMGLHAIALDVLHEAGWITQDTLDANRI